jgi:hypothetical protein
MDPNFSKEAVFKEIASSATTPASGKVYLYAKTDGKIYSKDDAGTETSLGGLEGSTGTVANAILRADGTAGDALKSSGLVVADAVVSITGITGDSSTNVITATGSGFANGQPIRFTALSGGSGLNTTTNYFVREVSGDTFKVETSIGGGAVNFTTNITAGTLLTAHNTQVNVAVSQNTPETNSALVLAPKGTGAFILGPPPDGTAANGNARGIYAVDLLLSRNGVTQVASAPYSTISGGRNNVASSDNATVSGGQNNTASSNHSTVCGGTNNIASVGNAPCVTGGNTNTASADFSRAGGNRALSDQFGMDAWSNGGFATNGASFDNRYYNQILKAITTNDTPTRLRLNAINQTAVYKPIPSGWVLSFIIRVTGVKSDGSAVAKYIREGTIKNVAGTTSLVGSIITLGTDHEDSAGTDVTITADDTTNTIDVSVTGIDAETWRWVAVVQGVEIAYGT